MGDSWSDRIKAYGDVGESARMSFFAIALLCIFGYVGHSLTVALHQHLSEMREIFRGAVYGTETRKGFLQIAEEDQQDAKKLIANWEKLGQELESAANAGASAQEMTIKILQEINRNQ